MIKSSDNTKNNYKNKRVDVHNFKKNNIVT